MYTERLKRILIPSIALLALTVALVITGLAATGIAGAGPRDGVSRTAVTVQTADAIVEFGDPVQIAKDERVESVVAFGGDVTVAGTVTHSVVAIGGDVRLLPTADVGQALTGTDPSVVSVGGTITVAEGAAVNGELQRIDEFNWPQIVDATAPDVRADTWIGFSFLGWIVQTAIFLVLGLVAAALLPKQMTAVARSLAARPGASFGWGALTFFIVVPAAAILLLVSVIGILVLVPAIVVVPLIYFFASLSVAVFIVQRLISRTGRAQNLMLATALGVVGTTIVSRIPVAGGLALLVMILFGTGAAVLAVLDWRRNRRLTAAPAPAGGPAAGQTVEYAPVPYAAVPAAPFAAPAPGTAAPAQGVAEVTAVTSAVPLPEPGEATAATEVVPASPGESTAVTLAQTPAESTPGTPELGEGSTSGAPSPSTAPLDDARAGDGLAGDVPSPPAPPQAPDAAAPQNQAGPDTE